jgi:hypothetical protein
MGKWVAPLSHFYEVVLVIHIEIFSGIHTEVFSGSHCDG